MYYIYSVILSLINLGLLLIKRVYPIYSHAVWLYVYMYRYACLLFVRSFSSHSKRIFISELMAIEQGFFTVLYFLWHGIFVNNGHFKGPVTLTPNAERLAMEPPNYLGLFRSVAARIRTPTFRLRGKRSYRLLQCSACLLMEYMYPSLWFRCLLLQCMWNEVFTTFFFNLQQ